MPCLEDAHEKLRLEDAHEKLRLEDAHKKPRLGDVRRDGVSNFSSQEGGEMLSERLRLS